MAITNGYTTLALLKTYLGVTSEDSGDDALIEDCVERASRVIDAHCRRQFYADASTTYKYDAIGDHINGRTLYLDKDLLSITTLTNGDGNEISSDDYALLPTNDTPKYAIKLKASSGLSWTYSDDYEEAISVLGSWGYASTVPGDIEQACIRLSAMLYRQKANQAPIDQVAVSATGVPLIPGGLPRDIKQMIESYRRHSL